jgi:uncharacterized protein (DUF1697 family)
MTALIALLRGVNLGNRRMSMEQLRTLLEGLGLRDVQTYIQSGNAVFRAQERGLPKLPRRIEEAIEREFGFQSDVILRTAAEVSGVIARNPFAGRSEIVPGKLLVWFLAADPGDEVRNRVLAIPAAPEEVRVDRRELYIYFPNGQARPKLSMAAVERALNLPGTGRNWNTVLKLLEMAEVLNA